MLHIVGLIWTFILTAIFSSGVTLAPMAVTWSSIWVYVTFALCMIPGYILGWLTVMAVLAVCGIIGVGIAALFGAFSS